MLSFGLLGSRYVRCSTLLLWWEAAQGPWKRAFFTVTNNSPSFRGLNETRQPGTPTAQSRQACMQQPGFLWKKTRKDRSRVLQPTAKTLTEQSAEFPSTHGATLGKKELKCLRNKFVWPGLEFKHCLIHIWTQLAVKESFSDLLITINYFSCLLVLF